MTRELTVLNVAYPLAPIGPDAVGGAEQVVSSLDHALVAAGKRSIVVACEGSRCEGELLAIAAPQSSITDEARLLAHRATFNAILQAMAEWPVDVVHMHGVDFHAYLPPPGPPVLITLHLPLSWYPRQALNATRPQTWLTCVSWAQHHTRPPDLNLLPPIQNGVHVDKLSSSRHARRGFALVLGRICPEKAQHIALEAAQRASVPLLLCGCVFPYPEHIAYFAERITPLLDCGRRWVGSVGFDRKRRLLSAARCVLLPSTVPETSSLVAMEALACGTPVIAFRAGALPEIIVDGVTGFLVEDTAQMAAAISRTDRIDPAECRRIARERFDASRMTTEYLAHYTALANLADPQFTASGRG